MQMGLGAADTAPFVGGKLCGPMSYFRTRSRCEVDVPGSE